MRTPNQIATNLTGSIQVARAALPHLRAQGGGRIIQISTMGGQATFPGGALYHTSKWGVEGFMASHSAIPRRWRRPSLRARTSIRRLGASLWAATPTQPCTLRERLADLEAQKDLALSTDVASPD